MIQRRLENCISKKRCTLLAAGPMSLNCVDATIEIANECEVPIMLIASRRQIDSEEFGGGYVNNWTTPEFAEYVIDYDKKGKVILARDHGGPWQNEKEKERNLSLRRSMESAKSSYQADIKAGFQMLHIDPSVDIHAKPDIDETLERIYELYEFCWACAQNNSSDIIFEIGTEEQSGSTNTQEELEYTLAQMKKFCERNRLPFPAFVVIQSGTRVLEMKNVGSFDSPMRVADELPAEIQVPKMIEICNRYGIFMKEHNTDYLSTESLRWHPRLGIHAANVAPEFGVAESRAFMELLESNKLGDLSQRFIDVSVSSQKWKKWMLPDSIATDRDKALISGHYIFSSDEFKLLKKEAQSKLQGIDVDIFLKDKVKQSIFRYVQAFRMVN